MSLRLLDKQLLATRAASEAPALSEAVWSTLATTIYNEIISVDELVINADNVDAPRHGW
jgi:hypothetical protein